MTCFGLLKMGCNNQPERSGPVEMVSIEVGVTSFIGEIATYIAQREGYFEEERLDVTIRVNQSGKESVRQLLSGEVDIAYMSETPFLYAALDSTYFDGQPAGEPVIFANMILASQIQRIVARTDAGLSGERYDLSGLRVGVTRGTQSEYHFDSFLLENQADTSAFEILNLTPAEQKEALRAGDIDVMVTWEPYASEMLAELGDQAHELRSRLTYSTLWLAVTLNQTAEHNPYLLAAYLRAIRRAQVYILDHRDEIVHLLAEETGARPEVIRDVMDYIDYELSLSERMYALISSQYRWMVARGSVPDDNVQIEERIVFYAMEEAYPMGITLAR